MKIGSDIVPLHGVWSGPILEMNGLQKSIFPGWASLMIAGAGAAPGSKDIGAVWLLGDSITQGSADEDPNGSPRKYLHGLLAAGGYTFTFTGHSITNAEGLPVTGATASTNLFQYHSGISGSVIGNNFNTQTGMTQNLGTFWTSGRLAVVKPRFILVMLGTNDINGNIDLPNAPARLTAFLNGIYALPGIGTPTVLVASIAPNRTDVPADPVNTAAFNATVPGIVQTQRASGRNVHFVDQFTPLDTNYATFMRSDNLHVNAAGNGSIARQWFNKIEELTAPLSGFVSWAQAQGIAADESDDGDHDGIPTLMEYALGYSPHVREVPPALVRGSAGFEITWPKGALAAADPEIRFVVQVSPDLEIWQTAGGVDLTETAQLLKLRLARVLSPSFARLKVIRTTP